MSAADALIPAPGLLLDWAHRDRRTCLLTVAGELDDFTVGLFAAKVERVVETCQFLIVDLTGCTFVSSAGLHALEHVSRALPAERSLAVVCDQPHLSKVLSIAGLARVIPSYPTLAKALATVRTAQHLRLAHVSAATSEEAVRRPPVDLAVPGALKSA